MKLTFIGTVARLGEEKATGAFRRREIVVSEGGDELRPIPVEFTASPNGSDRILSTLDLALGDLVKVEAFLSGREWEGRVFLRLSGLTIEKASFQNPASQLPPPATFPPETAKEGENLPF